MMTRDDVRKLAIGTIVRALVSGCGHVCDDNDREEWREFDSGDPLMIAALDVSDNGQDLAVTVVAWNSVVNVFDAGDYGGLYPFAPMMAAEG
jgi:hypothetical protein